MKKSVYAELYDLQPEKMGRQRRKQWKTELQRTFVLWLENGASIKKADGRGV